ncbi:DEAD/DEAH box helicase [Marinobacterium rhizophilum]|uniref:DEAD/DEAH box helicase n=1 Tax=Marinobacterium rhizophilum TaxID=420402 RepID=A0ABY5HQF9_9GAMM|nr:DEAD/DEAH box helicase [Marinobacterium rhizophilum]UTW13444.1 DEAD/DEAH box helicase [Marinobacterium rhizophilum]
MSFLDLDLDLELQQHLIESGFSSPTPIQQQSIPLTLDGQDILATAPTGSGKTLAFLLPALQHLLDQPPRTGLSPRVLILSPTRELASQILRVVESFAAELSIDCGLIVGGVPYGNQKQIMEAGMDLLIATPGRLLELDEKDWVDLSDVNLLIIDEADRMLDLGFQEPLNEIASLVPTVHQTLMFSATLESAPIQLLAGKLLKPDASQVAVSNARAMAGNIEHSILRADNDEHKLALFKSLISDETIDQALVFVNSRKQVEQWVAIVRAMGIMCDGLHGEMDQGERTLHMKQLRRGRLKVLVATDVASRGLDLANITHVINLNLPLKADSYIHRAGRAGRDGSQGIAVSIVDSLDWPRVGRIERYLQQPLKRRKIEGLEPSKPEPRADKQAKKSKAKAKAKKKADIKPGKSRKKLKGPRPATPRQPDETGDQRSSASGKPRTPSTDRAQSGGTGANSRNDSRSKTANAPRRHTGSDSRGAKPGNARSNGTRASGGSRDSKKRD